MSLVINIFDFNYFYRILAKKQVPEENSKCASLQPWGVSQKLRGSAKGCHSSGTLVTEMDAFEGIHCVQLSPSLKPAVASGPGYEVLVTGNSAIAVYSSPTFFGQLITSGPQAEESRQSSQEEGCTVGR